MRYLLWSVFFAALLLSGCGWDGSATRQNDITPLTSIAITADYSTIARGTSVKLKAVGNFSGYFTRDISDQVTWTSDATGVAAFVTTANPSRVTGQSAGSAVLTATMNGVSATFNLTVSPATATAVTISADNLTLAAGLSEQFKATGTFSDGTTQDITFDSTWTSSDTAAATVSDTADDTKGLVKAVAAGTTTITAAFDAVSDAKLLTVTEPQLESIAVTPADSSVLSLSTATFTATGTYSDESTVDITSRVTWSSSNTNVAPAPASTGLARTINQGTATITATLGNVSGSTTLAVNGGNLVGISIPTMTLIRGNAGFISATGTFSNGSTRDITGALTWEVDDTGLATVPAPTGNLLLVTAGTQRTGTTTIRATAPGVSGIYTTAPLAVTTQTVSSLVISLASSSQVLTNLTAGTSVRFKAVANLNDGTTQDVTAKTTWTSSASTVATPGTTGAGGIRIIGAAAGSATITASFGNLTQTAVATFKARTFNNFAITPGGTQSVGIGSQASFSATATYSDGTTVDVTDDATWAIDDGNIAVFPDSTYQPGQAVGVGSGTTTLRVTFNSKSATVTIKVP